ncbi:MAG: hypothetical protein IPP13_21915 [Kouleothrix sp.]|nr:hypothetical protein [Kouleothrix sp.]
MPTNQVEWTLRASDEAGHPRTIAIDIVPWLTVQVTRHHRYPGAWVVQAPPAIETIILAAIDLEDAKTEALALMRARLASALALLNQADQRFP